MPSVLLFLACLPSGTAQAETWASLGLSAVVATTTTTTRTTSRSTSLDSRLLYTENNTSGHTRNTALAGSASSRDWISEHFERVFSQRKDSRKKMKYRKSRQKYRVTTKTNTRTPSKSSSARDLANSNNENVGDYNYYSYDDAVQQKSSSNQVDDNAAAAADDTVATDDATATSTDDATTAATTDDYYSFDDAVVSNDDGKTDNTDDFYTGDNELCSQFLVSFLEGTTDARDTCDGIMNAFVAAGKHRRSGSTGARCALCCITHNFLCLSRVFPVKFLRIEPLL
jgi:hypothetical protein